MKKYLISFLLFSFTIAQNSEFEVSYLSSEYVYINGGSEQGLEKGDLLEVIIDNQTIAKIEIVFTAGHSSSCKVINQTGSLESGLKVRLLKKISTPEIGKADSIKTEQIVTAPSIKPKPSVSRKQSNLKIRGSFSLEWYQYSDRNNSDYDHSQPGAALNLKAQNLYFNDLNLRIRARSRKYERNRSFQENIPLSEWRNRIYEFSVSFENDNYPVHFHAGRILANQFSGVGYIDGILVKHMATRNWQWGLFAGSQPEWQYSEFTISKQKYGVFTSFQTNRNQQPFFKSNLAVSASWHKSNIDREMLYRLNQFSWKNLFFYQSLEADINRDWRYEKTKKRIELTSLYVNTNYRFSEVISSGISFDNRKRYYTFEQRSIADSLFDDAFRHGLRMHLNLRFNKSYYFFHLFSF